MLVMCKKPFPEQTVTVVGDTYLVLEVYIYFNSSPAHYRIIDAHGGLGIYDADSFEIVSDKLTDFVISMDDRRVTLSHKLIAHSELNKMHVDGFWGIYFEYNNLEAKKLVKEVANILASSENVIPPTIEWYG